MKHVLSMGVGAVFGLVAFACGTTESTFTEGAENDGTPRTGNALPEIGPSGTGSACVTELKSAELAPTNLVMVYDKSGSMGDSATGFDAAQRWIPVNTGMKQFFADPYSKTVRASLQFFPLSDDNIQTACAHPYAIPAVPLTSAADPAFGAALDRTMPSGGTPTLPALEGGIAYAKEVAASRPDDKTVVVLVTDGEPGFWDPQKNAYVPGCPNNDVVHVATAAKAAREGAPSIPTYVVGVGPKLESLNAVAAAGGTNAAIMVDVNDPAATKSAIVGALDGIRRRELACDFAVPAPPSGQELDPYAVNVALKSADGPENLLSYSKDCGAADGWHYDDVQNPKRFLLCSASCEAARAGRDGKISIAFGCKTKISVH
jgi:hypothetical protein